MAKLENCPLCNSSHSQPHICWPAPPIPLTVAWISAAVAKLARLYAPDAHYAEDRLHCLVLQAIAKGEAEDPAACAGAALATEALDFDRWYD